MELVKIKKNESVSLDPGIRTFQTCYSQNKCIKIANNLKIKLNKYILKIDKVNEDKNIKNKNKKKITNRCYNKIDNLINDLHWKTINYLTNNYGIIMIGNMSTKNIVSNKSKTQLDKRTKRVALLMKLFVFKQRLQFKCVQNKLGYKEIDEAYTSKTCTGCSYLNEDLGDNKIFNCKNCHQIIGRDVNGARNIMINSF